MIAASARRDGVLDQSLVEVERVFADIDEHRHAAAQHEGVGRRDEGVRGHDDLVAGLHVHQQCRHLQRRGARVRQQRLVAAGALLDPVVAALGERPISRQAPIEMGFGNVVKLLAGHVRPVEGNVLVVHTMDFLAAVRLIRAPGSQKQKT
jgi:hypothetical protein